MGGMFDALDVRGLVCSKSQQKRQEERTSDFFIFFFVHLLLLLLFCKTRADITTFNVVILELTAHDVLAVTCRMEEPKDNLYSVVAKHRPRMRLQDTR